MNKNINLISKQIIIGFCIIILLSAFFLTSPLCSNNLIFTNPIDALFTSTSATSVTGLIVVDTFSYWNICGHFIILLLIQIGGISFMIFFIMFSLMFNRNITLNEQLLLKNSFGSFNTLTTIKKIFSFIIYLELLGAIVLFISFIKDFNYSNSFFKALFHSISAFCNAGFDLMGEISPYIGLSKYISNFTVNITIIFLITIGGLGFLTVMDLHEKYNFYKLHFQTKLILLSSNILIFLGTISVLFFEFYNLRTIGILKNIKSKILASLFQSVTTRTAGFNTIDQLLMNPITKFISILLMFIGGSPNSTAGGIKTITIIIIIVALISNIKGSNFNILKRTIEKKLIIHSMLTFITSIFLIAICSILITFFDNISIKLSLYETVSAFATVGLSMSLSPALTFKSKFVLILLMFIGKISILTFFFNIFNNQKKYNKYYNANIYIG